MTEIITLLESQSANKKNNIGQEQDSSPIITAGPDIDSILAKMDNTEDPFERMFIVMSELMPAITQWKEDELEELAGGIEELATMTDILASLQDHFNNMQEGYSYEEGLAFKADLDRLGDEIDNSRYLDDGNGPVDPDKPVPEPKEGSLKFQLQQAVKALDDIYTDWGGSDPGEHGSDFAATVNTKWNGINTWNRGDGNHNPGDLSDNIKPVLDEVNKLGTGLKNTSGVVQARFQFEVGNYETYIGVYKDMFKNWKNQLQSPIDGIKRAG